MQITDTAQIDRYYQALVERDSQYVGIFYVGVKTTGIFCIATCHARKPKRENVLFFTEVKELLQHGYRPCKVCKPTQHADQPPEDVAEAVRLLHAQPDLKLSDGDLREAGLQPEKIRRWFNQHYGLTFQAYQRMLRINGAFTELQKGQTVTDTAFDSGYDSLSGFGYTFKNVVGRAPNDSSDKTIIQLTRTTTLLGPMFMAATPNGICLLEFTDRRMLETEFADLQKRLNAVILAGENDHTRQLKRELAEYFAGERQQFEVALDAPGTPFQQLVWDGLQAIPYGQTASYSEQAQYLGRDSATRAVASANGKNRISIVIPCHRVIGKDGSLTGYGGGLERKRWLLNHEKAHANSPA